MPAYDFNSSSSVAVPRGRSDSIALALDLRGLDLTTPSDLIKNGRTPYAKNFRLYAKQSDDRQVAVSSRKGPGYYTTPLAETLSDSNTSSTGASTAQVGITTGIHVQPFTAPSNDRITRIDIKVAKSATSSGPILVQIYDSLSGKPNNLLSESSLLSGDISDSAAYVTARFVNAVKMVSGNVYHIVLVQQDDGKEFYNLSTTTAGTKALVTSSSLSNAVTQTYALNYRVYTAIDGADKGAYRFNRDNGQNITVVVFGTTLYQIDEATHSFLPILTGLSASASEYSFTNADNKVFWVNGYDELTNWDATDETINPNLIANPSFTVNATGWTGISGSSVLRDTGNFNSSPAGLAITAASGARNTSVAVDMKANRRYKVTYWAKGATATGNTQFFINLNVSPVAASVKPITASWAKYEMYYTPGVDVSTLQIGSTGVNFYIDDVAVVDTGIEYIIDTELPILSQITFHKDRAWGVVASDPNKIVFSENPGNPSNLPTRQQWYYAWLSVSFTYVPRPHNGSPITWIGSFQDSLTVFTQDKKYILSGYDRGSLNLRESTGNKGCLSRRGAIADENNIYFVADDGFYVFNGSADKKISNLISPLYDSCNFKENITPVIWKNQVRFYMALESSSVNNTAVIYDKDLEEMMYDTDVWVNRALYYNDADDDHQLVEFSSLVPQANLAEQNYNSLGAPIDFEYRLAYNSMKSPGQRKRIKKFFPLLQGVDSTFKIQLAMDKDFQDSPRIKDVLMSVNGGLLGQFKFGDGTLFGGDKSFKQHRQSYSGYAYYWQLRVIRKGVNNRVAFIGAQFSYKTKRL